MKAEQLNDIQSTLSELTGVLKTISNHLGFISHELKMSNAMKMHNQNMDHLEPFNALTVVMYSDMVNLWMKRVQEELSKDIASKKASNDATASK